MNEYKKIWDNILAQIEISTSPANFSTWFKGTWIMKEDSGTVYLAVPNTFVKEWLINKYHKNLLHLLREARETGRSLEYIISREDQKSIEINTGKEAFNIQKMAG